MQLISRSLSPRKVLFALTALGIVALLTGPMPGHSAGPVVTGSSPAGGTRAETPQASPSPAPKVPAKKHHAAPQAEAPLTATQLKQIRLASVPSDEWSEWYEPPVIESPRDEVELHVKMASNTAQVLRDGKVENQPVNLRSYNGGLVGPTFKLKPNDSLLLSTFNELPREAHHCDADHSEMDMNDPKTACLNTTNLHTHGLHISPYRPLGRTDRWSDNVMLSTRPGQKEQYDFQILPAGNPEPQKPATHYPGTFWYHAHQHGSTATQLASGMAGALIIKGDVDEHPGIKGANERVFIFQQLAFDADGEIKRRQDNRDIQSVMGQNWRGTNPSVTGPPKNTTINGRLLPKIYLRPGQVERWRFIDSGLFEMLDIWLEDKTTGVASNLYQIAVDGITLPRVREVRHVSMGPGYRTDIMVKAPENVPREGATLYLYKKPTAFTLDFGQTAPGQLLAIVEVSGQPCKPDSGCHSALPNPSQPLPAPKDMLPDITRVDGPPKQIVMRLNGQNKLTFQGQLYNHNTILPEFQLTKDRAEEWHITNQTGGGHPFHIHVNAFQLLDANGRPGEWHDTIIVPPKKTVKFRTRYDRFIGDFVLHCHILPHEDLGMMQRVRISEPAAEVEERSAHK
jgi:FtsP/CotA-like multicopper oxidase with cupredoxin domain